MSQETPQVDKGQDVRMVFHEAIVPDPVEEVKNGRVKWGKDNLYPQFLWYLVENSPIHQGIVTSKLNYTISGGLAYDGDETEFDDILSNGISDYTLNEVAEMVCLDDIVGSVYYLHCKLDSLTKKWYIDPVEFELIRPSENNEWFEYSENWATEKQDPIKTKWRRIPSFFNRSSDSTECILQVKTKSRQSKSPYLKKVTGGFFSQPEYSGGIPSILTDIEVNYFGYSEAVNGFMGGTMVYMPNGEPQSEDVRRRVLKGLKAEGTDRNRRGGITVVFGEGELQKPTVTPMNGNDLADRYAGAEERLINKIMIAHSVTNQKLFGVMSTASLSESDDEAAYSRFQKSYGSRKRKSIADSLNFVLKKLNGMKGTLSFNVPSLYDEDESEEQAIVDKIATFPAPLQTKVVNAMTPNMALKLAGLPPVPGGDVNPGSPAAVAMRALEVKDPILIGFENCGRERNGKKFIASRSDFSHDIDDDQDFIKSTFKSRFAALTDIQLNVLKAIAEGKSDKAIQDELHLDVKDLAAARKALDKGGYIDSGELTTKGQIEVVNIEEIEVVYTYETRPDAPPLQTQSRAFCKRMLELDRVYTREEINQISQAVDRNVWLYRGGWYHDPETDKNQPSCRHYWLQHISIR